MKKVLLILLILTVNTSSLYSDTYKFETLLYKEKINESWKIQNIDFLKKNRISDECYYRFSFFYDDIINIDNKTLLIGRVEGSISIYFNNDKVYVNNIDTRKIYYP